MIKAFIFDMDGVLTSSSEQHFAAWTELMKKYGYDLKPEVEKYTRGVSRLDSLNVILESVHAKDKFTLKEKQLMAASKNDVYVQMISQFTSDNLYTGVEELLIKLKNKGIKVALGSASKNGPLLLERLCIAEYFDCVVDVAKIKNSKPAPDIFLAAAQMLGLKDEECIGVEDAVAGVEAIKAANMFAVGIGEKNVLEKADIVYNDVSEIELDRVLEVANRGKG